MGGNEIRIWVGWQQINRVTMRNKYPFKNI